MRKAAVLSEDRLYRYSLLRQWDDSKGIVLFIGLNPSTADENIDDPTIRRCIQSAVNWGYGGMRMINLFGYRSTDPKNLLSVEDPIGWENDDWIRRGILKSDRIIAAWGTKGGMKDRDKTVMDVIISLSLIECLGVTKAGFPRHPLYLSYDVNPIRYFGR